MHHHDPDKHIRVHHSDPEDNLEACEGMQNRHDTQYDVGWELPQHLPQKLPQHLPQKLPRHLRDKRYME